MGEDKSTSVTLGALCTQDLEDVSKFAMFQLKCVLKNNWNVNFTK
jgi:hypothetical protein